MDTNWDFIDFPYFTCYGQTNDEQPRLTIEYYDERIGEWLPFGDLSDPTEIPDVFLEGWD